MSLKDLSEVDPLLKDLSEKKQSFRRNVVSLATELKEVRCRLASQEQSFARETLTRQEAEKRAKQMEEEMNRLQMSLEEKDWQIQTSTSAAEKYLSVVDDLRSKLSRTQATEEAVQIQSSALKEHEERVSKLEEQLGLLQKDLQARECSQLQLKDEVLRFENDIKHTLSKAGINSDCELRKILDEVSQKNIDKITELFTAKDQEIAKIRDEIRIMGGHLKQRTKELESQLEKRQRADRQFKKRVLKLEYCLHNMAERQEKALNEAERQDKAIKELKDEMASKQGGSSSYENKNFWDNSGFKIVASMSMFVLVLFAKR